MGAARQSVLEKGYCILESVYSERDCAEMREIFQRAWSAAGRPGQGGTFGFVMHPLLKYAPEMARFYANPVVIDALRDVLQDAPRLAHSGGLMSDATRNFTEWHYHRSDIVDEKVVWNLNRAERPNGIERVLGNVYIDGSSDEMGPLLLYPRRAGERLAPPFLDKFSDWPGQVVVHCAPGSMLIFDQSVFHAARSAKAGLTRRIFGGHYQGWNNPAPHREDNLSGGESFLSLKAAPLFRSLIENAATAIA
jgi:hypothetical protein